VAIILLECQQKGSTHETMRGIKHQSAGTGKIADQLRFRQPFPARSGNCRITQLQAEDTGTQIHYWTRGGQDQIVY